MMIYKSDMKVFMAAAVPHYKDWAIIMADWVEFDSSL